MKTDELTQIEQLKVDKNGFQPMYLQIANELEGQIESGALPLSSFLPSEKKLAEILGVHRVTVRNAYARLREKGLLVSQRGQGWRVNRDSASEMVEIGFLSAGEQSHVRSPVYQRIFDCLTLECQKRNIYLTHLLLFEGHEEDVVRALRGRHFNSLVIGGRIQKKVWDALLELPSRRIGLNDIPANPCSHYVVPDNEEGGRLAARRLFEAGHRSFAIVLFPQWDQSFEFSARRAGFMEELASYGVATSEIIELTMDFRDANTHAPVARQIQECGSPIGVFCCMDRIALALLNACQHAGIRVPAEASIIGFDGDAEGEERLPSLATIVQPVKQIAEEIVALTLGEHPDGSPGPGRITVMPYFREGGTLEMSADGGLEKLAGRKEEVRN